MQRPSKPGRTIDRGDPGFDAAVLGTSFSGRDPGRRPDRLVQANTADDVARALAYAAERGLKVSICSGGHSWAQNHIRQGGVLLDLSRFDQISIDAQSATAIAGPGVWSLDLDLALRKHKLFFPVAHAPDVCLGGFLLQGGFGWGSRALGIAAENLLGLDLMLADGRQVHASAQENADLFWAARGAGPGFFAVVLRYHLKLSPRPRGIGMAFQIFRARHLDAVMEWAHAIGPSIARSVEFQILLTPKAMGIMAPGIEVLAPVLADSYAQARQDVAFIHKSPLRKLASFTTPLLPFSTTLMSRAAALTHFPPRMHWCVDNMWTSASAAELAPFYQRVMTTLPPAPSHALWLNWRPRPRPDMAFSREDEIYFAAYGEWKRAEDDARYLPWATDCLQSAAHLSSGIQLADENLARRPAHFMAPENLARLDGLRATHDPQGRFNAYAGRPTS